MTEELDILRIVADNPHISQRKIAERTGVSLGQVNFLIKKCVKKGLIKIEGQTSKSVRYNLTPKGISEKATKTLQYIKISYGAVLDLSDKIKSLAEKYKSEGLDIYIYGNEDEMMEICKLAIERANIEYYLLNNTNNSNNYVVFYWDSMDIPDMKNEEIIKWINILE